jgi:hypothetical protein
MPLTPGRYPVTVEVSGYEPAHLEDVLVEPDGPPLRVELQEARRVAVEVRDASGRLLPGEASILLESGERLEPTDEVFGRSAFDSVPLEPARLEVHVGAHTWNRALGPEDVRAVFELPTHGELVVTWQRPRGSGPYASLGVEIEVADGSGRGEARTRFATSLVPSVDARCDLLPGDYDLTLVLLEDSRSGETRQVLGQRRVTVTHEGVTRVALD